MSNIINTTKLYKKFCNWKELDFSVDVNEVEFDVFFNLIINDNKELDIFSKVKGNPEIINLIKEYVQRYKLKNKYKKIIIKI